MGNYDNRLFITDFAIRTTENQRRMEYMSDISVSHEKELETLYNIVQNENALNELSSAVTCIAKNNKQQRNDADQITSDLLYKLFSMHGNFKRASGNAYRSFDWEPPYYYYDGTQMLNSFLGLIVLPFERFRTIGFREMERIMSHNQNYNWICRFIDHLHRTQLPNDDSEFIYSDYWRGRDLSRDSEARVYNFWNHLRNAFAHSGDGSLFFFPIAGGENARDITHIAFFDTKKDRDHPEIHYYFLAKIALNNVREIANRMQSIIRTIEESEARRRTNSPQSYEEAMRMVSEAHMD